MCIPASRDATMTEVNADNTATIKFQYTTSTKTQSFLFIFKSVRGTTKLMCWYLNVSWIVPIVSMHILHTFYAWLLLTRQNATRGLRVSIDGIYCIPLVQVSN